MYHQSLLFKLLKVYDNIVVFLFCHLIFNRNKKIRIQTIERFGDTEDDTVWQLFWGIKRIEDKAIRATIFQQILEETYHAEEFYSALKKFGTSRSPQSSYERRSLYTDDEPVWKLILYCHIGEAEAEMRFRHFLKHCNDSLAKKSVGRVLADEVGHVDSAYRLLKDMGVSDTDIKQESRRIFWQRRMDSTIFKLKRIGGGLLGLIFSSLYFLLGPFVKRTCQKRLRQPVPLNNTDFTEVSL